MNTIIYKTPQQYLRITNQINELLNVEPDSFVPLDWNEVTWQGMYPANFVSRGLSNPHADHNTYTFVHDDGRRFTGNRYEFRELYGFNPKRLCTGIKTSSYGWKLETTELSYSEIANGKIHHFIHKDGTEEHCTRKELRTKYNIPLDQLNMLFLKTSNKAKRVHGWRLFDQPFVNGNTDTKIYHFVNDDGREETLTKQEFLKKYDFIKRSVDAIVRKPGTGLYGWRVHP